MLTFILKNQVDYGIENVTVTRVSGFHTVPCKTKFENDVRIPSFHLLVFISQYAMDVRWLTLVQSNTTGPCFTELQNVSVTLCLKTFVRFKKDQKYLSIYINLRHRINWAVPSLH